jgi:hypothetical protein
MAGMLVAAVLAAAVIAQGAYIAKTRRQMDALTDQVQQLATESIAAEPEPAPPPAREQPWRRSAARAASAAPLPPPRFAPAPRGAAPAPPGTLPLPAAIDSPEARDQLRQFVAGELQRERDEQRERNRQRFEDDQKTRFEAIAKALGLKPEESQRLTDALTNAQTARREMRDKMQSGEINRADIPQQIAAMRKTTDDQVRQVLGDDGMKKFQELQRQDRGLFGPGGGGGRRGGGGGPPPGGGPGPPGGGPGPPPVPRTP